MKKYSFTIAWSPEDEAYVATSPEFPALSGIGGPNAEDALEELQEAIEVAIKALVEDGEPVPEPYLTVPIEGVQVGDAIHDLPSDYEIVKEITVEPWGVLLDFGAYEGHFDRGTRVRIRRFS